MWDTLSDKPTYFRWHLIFNCLIDYFFFIDGDYKASSSSKLIFDNRNASNGQLVETFDTYNVYYHVNSIYSKVATFPCTILDSNLEDTYVDRDESMATLKLDYDNHMW